MTRSIFLLLLLSLCASAAQTPDVSLYDQVLRNHVTGQGKVDYAAIKKNFAPLDRYVQQIAEVSPASHPQLFPSKDAKLAYWLNAYNALVLHAFTKDYPEKRERLKGLWGKGQFFYWTDHKVGGKSYDLDHIENAIIRKQFQEPLIHFGLVCASSSCPHLQQKAFTAENLDKLLQAEARRFLRSPENVKIDRQKKVVTLSKLFDWYKEDFGKNEKQIFEFLAKYNPEFEALAKNASGWKISHFDYDWSPNDVRK